MQRAQNNQTSLWARAAGTAESVLATIAKFLVDSRTALDGIGGSVHGQILSWTHARLCSSGNRQKHHKLPPLLRVDWLLRGCGGDGDGDGNGSIKLYVMHALHRKTRAVLPLETDLHKRGAAPHSLAEVTNSLAPALT